MCRCIHFPVRSRKWRHLCGSYLATADQLKGLPPALVLTSECDVLRDEGEVYVSQLIDAGVYTVGMRVLKTIHAFMTTPIPETPQYRASLKTIVAFIKDQLELA